MLAWAAKRFPPHIEAFETVGGALMIAGLAILGFAYPRTELRHVTNVHLDAAHYATDLSSGTRAPTLASSFNDLHPAFGHR
jgi:hypothetical protein